MPQVGPYQVGSDGLVPGGLRGLADRLIRLMIHISKLADAADERIARNSSSVMRSQANRRASSCSGDNGGLMFSLRFT